MKKLLFIIIKNLFKFILYYLYFMKNLLFFCYFLNLEWMRCGLGGFDFFDRIVLVIGGFIVYIIFIFFGIILGFFVVVRISNVNENICMDIKFIV